MKIDVVKKYTFGGHSGPVYTLAPDAQEDCFFSAAADGMVVRWSLSAPDQGKLLARVPNPVYALAPLSGGKLMAVGQNFEGIHLLNLADGKEEASLKLGNTAIFDMQALDNQLFVACGDGRVLRIEWASMRIEAQAHYATQHARCMAVFGEVLAVGYSDNCIRLLDRHTLRLLQTIEAHANSLFTLAFHSSGMLFSGSRDAYLKLWKQRSDGQYSLYAEAPAHLYTVNHIAFSPDGRHFATCSKDKSIKIWETAEAKLLKVIDKARHAGHGTSVNKLLWQSPNTLLSASDDRSISVWEIAGL